MIVKRMASICLIILGCLCISGYSEAVLAQEKTDVTEVKENMTEYKDNRASKDMSGYPVIGHLKTRDKIITIRTGPDGPLYTVETKDGEILAVNYSAEKLYAKFPELKNVLEQGIAVDDATNRFRNKADLTPIVIHREIQK